MPGRIHEIFRSRKKLFLWKIQEFGAQGAKYKELAFYRFSMVESDQKYYQNLGILHITPKVLYTFWGMIPKK
jgi:hypothetical protein